MLPRARSLVSLATFAFLVGSGAQAQRRKTRPAAATPAAETPTAEAPPTTDLPPPESPPAVPEKETRRSNVPRCTAHVYREEVPEPSAAEALAGFAASLAGDQRINYSDVGDLLEPPEEADAALGAADANLVAAKTAYEQMQLEDARLKAEAAIKHFERYLPRLATQPDGMTKMRDAWIRLAGVAYLDGNKDGAREALRHAFALDPQLQFSTDQFPPQMKKLVKQERLLFETLGTGKLTVTSEPAGAGLYLDGVARGKTPVTLEEVAAGTHYVTLERRGYVPLTTTVQVTGGGDEAKSEQPLSRYDDDPMARLSKARSELDGKVVPPSLVEAAHRLHVELLVLGRLKKAPGGVVLTAWLYDARPNAFLKKVELPGGEEAVGDLSKRAAVELMTNVRLDGVAKPPEGPGLFARLGEAYQSFRETRAFWPVVGGVGGLIVVGVVVGIVAGTVRGGPARPSGLSPGEEVILLGALR